MSDLLEVVKELESSTFKLMQRNKNLESEMILFRNKLKDLEKKNKSLEKAYRHLEAENESLKSVNAMLGSKEYKRETKLKINRLIREIDSCIINLSE
jgi:predicted nuclease with TOPRIM domain